MLKTIRRFGVQQIRHNSKYVPPGEKAVQQHTERTKKKARNDRIGKYLQLGLLTMVSGSVLMYMWQPWNPYSVDVSKKLRKGLWEEREGKDDFLKALKNYQEALNALKQEDPSKQLSLNYTGIVLKIAEMYEKIGDKQRVGLTYFNLSSFIFDNLIHNTIPKDDPERDLLIDRDLIVITRWAMLEQELKEENWNQKVDRELADRIGFLENHEIGEKLSWLKASGKSKIDLMGIIDIWANENNDPTKWIDENVSTDEGKEFLKCWDVFRSLKGKSWPQWIESYLRLRDFYAMFLMSTGEVKRSLPILESNLLWTLVAGFQDHSRTSTQIVNIASAWFKLGQDNSDIKAYRRAKKIYEHVIEVSANNEPILPISYYSLGVLYLQLQDKKSANEYFDKAKGLAVEMNQTQLLDKINEELQLQLPDTKQPK